MRTRSALALSIAGILVTGSTALAVNTQTLNNSPQRTTGNASVLLPDNPARQSTGTPAALQGAAGSTDTTADPAPRVKRTASPSSSPKSTATRDAGDDKGGLTNTIEPGDDKGGSRAPEPGDDSGGHGGKDDD